MTGVMTVSTVTAAGVSALFYKASDYEKHNENQHSPNGKCSKIHIITSFLRRFSGSYRLAGSLRSAFLRSYKKVDKTNKKY